MRNKRRLMNMHTICAPLLPISQCWVFRLQGGSLRVRNKRRFLSRQGNRRRLPTLRWGSRRGLCSGCTIQLIGVYFANTGIEIAIVEDALSNSSISLDVAWRFFQTPTHRNTGTGQTGQAGRTRCPVRPAWVLACPTCLARPAHPFRPVSPVCPVPALRCVGV